MSENYKNLSQMMSIQPEVKLMQLYINIVCMKPGLYLGNSYAATINILTKYKINHILTIGNCPVRVNIMPGLRLMSPVTGYKQICLYDLPSEDLLSHFDETDKFISLALKNGSILVHYDEFSSSAAATAVVLAFIMKSERLSYLEVLQQVKHEKNILYQNREFVMQLELYWEMGYKIDQNYVKYKAYRLQKAANRVRKMKVLPQDYFDLIRVDPGRDPGLTHTQLSPNVCSCKKCRRIVATESNLITHHDRHVNGRAIGLKTFFTEPLTWMKNITSMVSHHDQQLNGPVLCQKMFFIEPIGWMNNITKLTEGQLHCPECNARLGSFSWTIGTRCPCGCNVAPSFCLVPSKVNWSNIKNGDVTI